MVHFLVQGCQESDSLWRTISQGQGLVQDNFLVRTSARFDLQPVVEKIFGAETGVPRCGNSEATTQA